MSKSTKKPARRQRRVIVLTDTGKQSTNVSAGSIFVVPKNHWHQHKAKLPVTVLGATPGVTDHSDKEPAN